MKIDEIKNYLEGLVNLLRGSAELAQKQSEKRLGEFTKGMDEGFALALNLASQEIEKLLENI